MDDSGRLIAPRMESASTAPGQMRRGVAASLALHSGAILLILFSLPQPKQPLVEPVIPVNLVLLGDKTASPSATILAPLPQQQAKETATSQAAEAVPAPQTPPSPIPDPAAAKSAADLPAAAMSARKLDTPRPVKPAATAAVKPRQRPSAADTLAARLKALAQLRQPTPPLPPNPRRQDGRGESSVTAANVPGRATDATYAVKDFIRAQVERRWNLNESAAAAQNWTVSIRIELDLNGRVLAAEIVDDSRFRDNNAYRDFALSARNAVLLSSPLLLPPGDYDLAKDIVVDFDPRQVVR